MNAKQLFFERYNGYQEYPERLLHGLSDNQIRHSPHPSLNPIAWTLWHLARCEDVCVNRVLSDNAEVLQNRYGCDPDEWTRAISDITGETLYANNWTCQPGRATPRGEAGRAPKMDYCDYVTSRETIEGSGTQLAEIDCVK